MNLSRRTCLQSAAFFVSTPALAQLGTPSANDPSQMSEPAANAIAQMLNGREALPGRIGLRVAKLAENGFSVPIKVNVESPMLPDDYVRTIHLFAPLNPTPTIARIRFSSRSGEAYLNTRIRLADSQHVFCFAEMNDDSVYVASSYVLVTLGGCVDPAL